MPNLCRYYNAIEGNEREARVSKREKRERRESGAEKALAATRKGGRERNREKERTERYFQRVRMR